MMQTHVLFCPHCKYIQVTLKRLKKQGSIHINMAGIREIEKTD